MESKRKELRASKLDDSFFKTKFKNENDWMNEIKRLAKNHKMIECIEYIEKPIYIEESKWNYVNNQIINHILATTNKNYHQFIKFKSAKKNILALSKSIGKSKVLLHSYLQLIKCFKFDSTKPELSLFEFEDMKESLNCLGVNFSSKTFEFFLIDSLSSDYEEIKENVLSKSNAIKQQTYEDEKSCYEIKLVNCLNNKKELKLNNYLISYDKLKYTLLGCTSAIIALFILKHYSNALFKNNQAKVELI